MTIENAISEYLEWKSSYAPSAAKAYKSCLIKLLALTVPLEKITQLHMARFIELNSRTYKPRTIVWYVNILKDFFGYYAGRAQVNPKLIRRPKYTSEPPNFLTEDEFERMEECLDDYDYYDLQKKCLLRLMWRTGMRVSEVCDLNLGDIQNDKNYCRIITKKNRRYRWIVWSGEDHKLLMRYIGSKICLDEHEALFTSNSYNSKGRVTTRSVERWLLTVAVRAGVERHVHPHMIRHGKAHFMLKRRANLNEVQEILGHNNIFSTQMYAKLLPDELKELADRYI